MGKMMMGILGGFSGTVGTVIGSVNKNGDDILRVKSKKPRTSQTEAQINQRTKFGLVTQFMQPLNPLLRIGFNGVAQNMSAYNYACMLALKNAVTGTAPDIALDYSKIRISDGDLHQVVKPTAQLDAGKIKFQWEDNSSSCNGQATDQAILVAYNADNYEYSYSIGEATRGAAGGTLSFPNHETGDQLLIFLFFQSAEGSMVSPSQYLGTIAVTE